VCVVYVLCVHCVVCVERVWCVYVSVGHVCLCGACVVCVSGGLPNFSFFSKLT